MTIISDVLVGVDWGTSNRRAVVIDAEGRCVAERSDDQGLLAAQGRFEASLADLLAGIDGLPPAAPVLMSGMVGSAQGWVEAPYCASTMALADLSRHLVPVPAPTLGRRCAIVPGLRHDGAASTDVMRGEETQLLGAVAQGHRDGWFVLPGTHSKWAELVEGRVRQFATYMTGELYALMGSRGTLSALLAAEQDADPAAQARSFEAGVQAARDDALSHALFGCRARVVAGQAPASSTAAYLSGVLIGSEWADVRRRNGGLWPDGLIRAIGSPVLAERHAQAARLYGRELECLDAHAAFIAALQVLRAGLTDLETPRS